MPKAEPAYTRLDVDERRAQLLELGTRLFTEHAYDELSMAAIARDAGISKALLYHYFPSKRDLFLATLQEKATELGVRVVAAGETPEAQLAAFLEFVEENATGYGKLVRSLGQPEVAEVVAGVRRVTAERIVAGLGANGPVAHAAVTAWLAFLDALILEWLEDPQCVSRDDVARVALAALTAALSAP